MALRRKNDAKQDKFSYNWADDDTESDSEFSGLKGTSPAKLEKLKSKKRDLIAKFKHDVGRASEGKSILNVVFIGTPGAGKSSTINTCIAAFSETKYQEFARAGRFNEGRQVTYYVESFKKERYIPERKNYCMPTLIDIAGFDDEESDINEELLRIVLYGCLPEGDSLMEAKEYADKHGIVGLQHKYKDNKDDLKVDRIVFVASAEQEVPENLIRSVVAAAHPTGGMSARNKKNIPMFGVMCKVDHVNVDDKEFLEREKKFIGCLGLTGSEHRYTRLVNYCNDVDKDKKRMDAVFPELDVPALRFLRLMCSSAYEIMGPAAGERYADTVKVQAVPATDAEREVKDVQPKELAPDRASEQVTMLLTYLLKGIIIAVFLYMIMMPPIGEEQLQNICSSYNLAKHHSGVKIQDLDKVCDNKVKIANPPLMLPLVAFIMIMVVLDFSVPKLVRKIMDKISTIQGQFFAAGT